MLAAGAVEARKRAAANATGLYRVFPGITIPKVPLRPGKRPVPKVPARYLRVVVSMLQRGVLGEVWSAPLGRADPRYCPTSVNGAGPPERLQASPLRGPEGAAARSLLTSAL